MKNIIITSALLLLLTGCGGKTTNIVSFTKPVAVEESGHNIALPNLHRLSNWDNDNIDVNIAIDTAISPEHIKFKTHKLALKTSISAKPIIVDGKIFVLTRDGFLTAFDKVSLKQLWTMDIVSKKSKSDYTAGGITHHNGKLFVTNGSRTFAIIDVNNGNLIFSKQFPDILITKPVIQSNMAILQTLGNQAYFLDLASKAILWDHVGNPETLQGGLPINPVIDNHGKAIISYTSGQVALIDLVNRAEVWQMDLSTDSTMPEYVAVNLAVSPIIEGKNGYFADNNGKIFKIDMDNGRFAWKKEIDDVRTINNTANALVMTTNGRQVIVLDKVSGKIIWVTDLGEAGLSRSKWQPVNYVSSLMVNNMLNIYTSGGECYVIDLSNGRIVQRMHVASKLHFVTITDKIRMFEGKNIIVSEPKQETGYFKIFDRFQKSDKAKFEKVTEQEVIKDVTNKPKKKKSLFKPFKFGNKKNDIKAE